MITVNGKEVKGQEEQTVADYLEENGYRMNRIAVELNGEILKNDINKRRNYRSVE